MTKIQNTIFKTPFWSFLHWNFDIVSSFDIRISGFSELVPPQFEAKHS
jgi:hypothetical protein